MEKSPESTDRILFFLRITDIASVVTGPETLRHSTHLFIINHLFFIIAEYELAVATRKKGVLLSTLGKRPVDAKKTLK